MGDGEDGLNVTFKQNGCEAFLFLLWFLFNFIALNKAFNDW